MVRPLRPFEPKHVIGLRNLSVCNLQSLLIPVDRRVPLLISGRDGLVRIGLVGYQSEVAYKPSPRP
jgi:hypothetical protein